MTALRIVAAQSIDLGRYIELVEEVADWLEARGIKQRRSGNFRLSRDYYAESIKLLTFDPKPAVVMVDVPIGLTDSGSRVCDLQARAYLKAPKASSVFPAPIRPTLVATSYVHACQIGEMTENFSALDRRAQL